jgi:PmbA protein
MDKLELAKWASDYALKKGASQAAVDVSNSRSVQIDVRDKKIETLKETTENNLSIYIYLDHKYSGHFSNDLRKASVQKMIDEAIAATSYLSADDFRELPDPAFYATNKPQNLDLVDKKYDDLTTEKRIKLAKAVEESAVAMSDQIISAKGSFSDSRYSRAKVLSNGFEGHTEGTSFGISSAVTVRDNDARPEDWAWFGSRFYNQLPSSEQIGQEAARRALQKIGQKKIDTGQYDMLVENRSMGRLINMFIGPMSARSLQQKSSYLEGKLDTKIASDLLTIVDDPFIPGGRGTRYYDSDGVAARKLNMIENGVLKNYYIDNYYGRKLGMDPTASGTSNLVFNGGPQSLEEMINSIDRGILVTSFNGGNSNGTTGDFSFGIGGMLIEKGKLTIPVYEMNITGSAMDFWQKLVGVGNDEFVSSSWRTPSMLFEGINFAGL